MRNQERENPSLQDVAPALTSFFSRYDKEDFTAAPVTIQQMFNDLMGTHLGDDHEYRQKCLMTLTVIADLGTTIAPFSQDILRHFNEKI